MKALITIPKVESTGQVIPEKKFNKLRDSILMTILHSQPAPEAVSYTSGLAPTYMIEDPGDMKLVPSDKIHFDWMGSEKALDMFLQRTAARIMDETTNFYVTVGKNGNEIIMELQ